MPAPARPSAAWHSLDVGLLHLVSLSSEQDFSAGSPQWLWLQGDLARVNRSHTPWVVLAAHRPFYVDSTDATRLGSDQGAAALLRSALEPLLWAGRVNLALGAHNHALQRMGAVLGGRLVQASAPAEAAAWGPRARLQLNPQATVHVLHGAGGAGFTNNSLWQFRRAPPYVEEVQYVHGPGVLTAHNATHLQLRVLEAASARLVENLWIVQSDPAAPWARPPGVEPPPPPPSTTASAVGFAVIGLVLLVGLIGGNLATLRAWGAALAGKAQALKLGEEAEAPAVVVQAPMQAARGGAKGAAGPALTLPREIL